jgi:DNA-binding protein Fis
MKGKLDLEEFKEKCKNIAKVWEEKSTEIFQNIPILKDESKSLQTKPEVRKVWKALGLYYTILNGQEEQFNNFYKEVLKEKELEELCINVRKDTKEKALVYISKFLQSLKDRRKRLAYKNSN